MTGPKNLTRRSIKRGALRCKLHRSACAYSALPQLEGYCSADGMGWDLFLSLLANRVTNAMSEEVPFAHLRNSSALHAAIITPNGVLILTPRLSGDEQSLIDFQPVALEALEIAAHNNRHVTEHLVPGRRGGRLYDKIVIHP